MPLIPTPSRYRGRFAPSPTGPLHFGSLVAALASFLDARHHDGEWLLRIEDLDPGRAVPGAAEAILRTLDSLGLHWDGAVLFQSGREHAYREALDSLSAGGHTFPCACSRREVAERGRLGPEGPIYPGTCRDGLPSGRMARAQRMRVDRTVVTFHDRLQGPQRQDLAREAGDFVVRRADGPFAYQLAVVVDDGAQQITHVVRGSDLLPSTGRQILLQQSLELSQPGYLHFPVAVDPHGNKLSKSLGARPLPPSRAASLICAALRFLGQSLPADAGHARPEELLAYATGAWDPVRIPPLLSLPVAPEVR